MARNRTTTTAKPDKPLTAEDKRAARAAINARHQAGDLTAEDAQAEIDALNGTQRITDDETGEATVVAADESAPPAE